MRLNAAATCTLPSLVCAVCRLEPARLTELELTFEVPVVPASFAPPPRLLSACLSASPPSDSLPPSVASPVPPVPVPEAASPPSFWLEAPCEPARDVLLSELLPLAETLTLRARALRCSDAVELSLRTEMVNDAPTPTLPPAAAALAPSSRVVSFLAVSVMSSLAERSVADVPRAASARAPEMSSESTGVMEMPPCEPASVLSVSVEPCKAAISAPLIDPLPAALITAPSAALEITSAPNTPDGDCRADAQAGSRAAALCEGVCRYRFMGLALNRQRAALAQRNGSLVPDNRFGLRAGNMHRNRARHAEVALRIPGLGVRRKHELFAFAAGHGGEFKAARRDRAIFNIGVVRMQRHRYGDAYAERERFLLLICGGFARIARILDKRPRDDDVHGFRVTADRDGQLVAVFAVRVRRDGNRRLHGPFHRLDCQRVRLEFIARRGRDGDFNRLAAVGALRRGNRAVGGLRNDDFVRFIRGGDADDELMVRADRTWHGERVVRNRDCDRIVLFVLAAHDVEIIRFDGNRKALAGSFRCAR